VIYVEAAGSGPRLALIHGFTQSGRSWGPVGAALESGYRLLKLDAPGHGRSAAVDADLPGGADLMAAAVKASGGPASWLGYSMGGRFALHVAVRHPHLVERLVLVSATAGIDDPRARAERRHSDDALAGRVEAEGLETFVRWWLAQPIFASLPTGAAEVGSRLDGTPGGLAASLRRAGTGTQDPLWDRLGSLDMPVLVVAGALDTKYRELGARLQEGIGSNATFQLIEAAGHACHLEQPDRFVEVVTAWMEGVKSRSRPPA
jgi:2-succinyl-6-hydroxy-2,4-cyclohexadiene-1-carboxylate synthase